MTRIYIAIFCAVMAAPAAKAAVTVEEHELQKGLFVHADCVPDPADPAYDECQCDADVRYPELQGLLNGAVQTSLNASFKKAAENVACEGKQAEPVKPEKAKESKTSPASVSHHYEVTFQSPDIIAFKFTDWEYTGGAHGNGSFEGVIIDLTKGKVLSTADLFSANDLAGVNQVIYDTLSAKPEGEAFRDQIESRKGAFIGEEGCQGCTLTLTQAGLQVVCQTYEVASFAEGNMEVPIPAKYVSYPAVAKLLSEPKPTVLPEKK